MIWYLIIGCCLSIYAWIGANYTKKGDRNYGLLAAIVCVVLWPLVVVVAIWMKVKTK